MRYTEFQMYSYFIKGVEPVEIIISHLVCEFISLVGLTCVLFIVLLYIFKMQCLGSLPLAVLISLFQGMSGIFEGINNRPF